MVKEIFSPVFVDLFSIIIFSFGTPNFIAISANISASDFWKIYTNNFLKEVDENEWITYLVYDDENIVWCIGLVIENILEKDKIETKLNKIWIILELFIDENFRGQSLWKKLMDIWENYFRENNCEYSYLDVFYPNKLAYWFYEKLGYSSRLVTMCKKL